MKIYTTVELNHAQDALLDCFQNLKIEQSSNPENIVITIATFYLQKIRITVNKGGIIENVKLVERYD
jgi:hypothetical protein